MGEVGGCRLDRLLNASTAGQGAMHVTKLSGGVEERPLERIAT